MQFKTGATELVAGAAAVWRVTHLLHAEDGPWDLLARLRKVAGTGVWGRMLDCFYCLSVWVALPFAFVLGTDLWSRALLWPGLSGLAILLERATGGLKRFEPLAEWHEEREIAEIAQFEKEETI